MISTLPKPPLTARAKEHLLIKGISHAGLNATSKGAASSGSLAEGVVAVDQNGVPTNVPNGHYPGENCEPEGVPVEFNYPQYPLQFIILPNLSNTANGARFGSTAIIPRICFPATLETPLRNGTETRTNRKVKDPVKDADAGAK